LVVFMQQPPTTLGLAMSAEAVALLPLNGESLS